MQLHICILQKLLICWVELNIHGLEESCGMIFFASPCPLCYWVLINWYFGRSSQLHCKPAWDTAETSLHTLVSGVNLSPLFPLFTFIYWMGLGKKMYVYLHKSWLSSGRCLPPMLELFRGVGEVDTSAYPVKSRLTKRVKQMQQRLPALKTKWSGSQNYCYWAQVGGAE